MVGARWSSTYDNRPFNSSFVVLLEHREQIKQHQKNIVGSHQAEYHSTVIIIRPIIPLSLLPLPVPWVPIVVRRPRVLLPVSFPSLLCTHPDRELHAEQRSFLEENPTCSIWTFTFTMKHQEEEEQIRERIPIWTRWPFTHYLWLVRGQRMSQFHLILSKNI